MARERIDQILRRKGLVNEAQIKQALLRQKSHQGRLGTHLMYYRYLTERDLVDVLQEHFGVPGVVLSEIEIPAQVINKLPVEIVDEHQVLPFAFDPATRTLSLAMLDPDNTEAVYLAQEASGAWNVQPHVAAEPVLRRMIHLHYHGGRGGEAALEQVIELPDLFGGEAPASGPREEAEQKEQGPGQDEEERVSRKVLMVTRSPFLKSLLVSIFEREGCDLTVLSERVEVLAALRGSAYDHLLVSEEMEGTFHEWVREADLPLSQGEVSVFSSISGALLDNPAPYHRMARSLINTLTRTAELRTASWPWKPPYGLICRDAGEMAEMTGMSRIAADGLRIASLLLLPVEAAAADPSVGIDRVGKAFFADPEETLETAKALCFQWDVSSCLSFFFRFLGGPPPGGASREEEEWLRAAQILVFAWYRHSAFRGLEGPPDEVLAAIRQGLREQEGRLYPPEVTELYHRMIDRRTGRPDAAVRKDLFMVGEATEQTRQLAAHLRRDGYSIVTIRGLSEAQHLYERRRPDVIVLDYDGAPDRAIQFGRFVHQDGTTLLYAFTTSTKPSLVLNLLESGFDDVFTPPFNYGLISARIGKALAAKAKQRRERESPDRRGFHGSFRELPFVDLMQALAMSQRSVAIELRGPGDEAAEIYLQEGRMVYARCGDLFGVEAVYRVIRWREEGTFQVGPVTEYPEENISLPNDFVLMEGCRLLDEGRI